MFESILTLIAVAICLGGTAILSLTFKASHIKVPVFNRLVAFVVGLLVIALGMYVLPHQNSDQPDTYYRK